MSSLNEDAVGTLQPVTPVGEVLSKVDIIPIPNVDDVYSSIIQEISSPETDINTDEEESPLNDESFDDLSTDASTSFNDILKENGIPTIMKEEDESGIVEVWESFDDVFTEDGDLIAEVSDLFTESAKIDDDIKDIISILNDKGYKTVASCSGHPSARSKSDGLRDGVMYNKLYSSARVVFDKDYKFSKIPEGWKGKKLKDGKYGIYVEGPTFNIVKGLHQDQFSKWKKKYMYRLKTWANELPKVGDSSKDDLITESMESMIDALVLESMTNII